MAVELVDDSAHGSRIAGHEEQAYYAYSFAGTATSNDSYPTFEAGCTTLVEAAIPAMLKKWTEDGGMAALLEEKP